ncbi:two-component system chemotaxis response regulator CheB [Oceanisphaera litoralis]|uniref:chemotaxis protein CheB n=1 Tax=Oceanisphaera litoralis TaxID=225144 RepID=UPI001958723A|nr:chemotaxis protein CheB [Oceanisphaera litoralis]MBM7455280.1 two-component system chemotaxis response regulator CheB [Oceanisphaera litoralis]
MNRPCDAVVIGGSAGAIQALPILLEQLPADFALPVIVVLHRREGVVGHLDTFLGRHCALPVIEAEDKQSLQGGHVYLAPAGYHLLLEQQGHFSLSVDARVSYSRPSIDVLFESAADVYADRLAGIILTGANSDGSAGLARLKAAGGLAVVQDPETALADVMPRSALKATRVDRVLGLQDIARLLSRLAPGQP